MTPPDDPVNPAATTKLLPRDFTLAHRALAEMFPNAFTAEKYQEHKPLKLGIYRELVALGILPAGNRKRAIIGHYFSRRMYAFACVEGAVRVDLDGNPAGVVTAEEAAYARAHLARLDETAASHVAKREAARAAWKAQRDAQAQRAALSIEDACIAARERLAQNNKPASVPPPPPPPAPTGPRLSLADLKAAALARRNEGHALSRPTNTEKHSP